MSENLQYRLYNLSIDPPGNAWPDIALQLDKETTEQSLSLKLQQAALEPPPTVWENIVSTLHETKTASVVSMRRTWTRIAVAAMVIGIIVTAGLFYLLQNESANGTANQAKTAPAPANTNTQTQKEEIQIDVPEPRTTI